MQCFNNLNYAECVDHHCKCVRRYVLINGICEESKMNRSCTNDKNCNEQNFEECGKNDIFSFKQCVCQKNYKPSPTNPYECIKTKGCCNANFQCLQNETCSKKDGDSCMTCDCKKGFEKKNGKCQLIPGYCDLDIRCVESHSECDYSKNRCKCWRSYFNITGSCEFRSRYCDYDSDCFGNGAFCTDHNCQCRDDYWFTGAVGNFVDCDKKGLGVGSVIGVIFGVSAFVGGVSTVAAYFILRRRHRLTGQPMFFWNQTNQIPQNQTSNSHPIPTVSIYPTTGIYPTNCYGNNTIPQ